MVNSYTYVPIETRFDNEMKDTMVLLAVVLALMSVTTSRCARG